MKYNLRRSGQAARREQEKGVKLVFGLCDAIDLAIHFS
jgi:hypothetical protein